MIINHLKFALRLFRKGGLYSFLNILGLSIGISVGILVLLFMQHDLTYDQHHEKHERIYRLTQHLKATGADFQTARVSSALPELLMQDITGLESFVRMQPLNTYTVKHIKEDGTLIQFDEERIFKTDSNIFEVFTHSFIEGNPAKSLQELNDMVITESIAQKYFDDNSALGKILEFDGEQYKVTGVIEDVSQNSHLKFDILFTGFEGIQRGDDEVSYSEAFWNPNVFGYFLFEKGYKPSLFYDQFPTIFEKYYRAFANVIDGTCTPTLEPLADVHFYSDKGGDLPQGNISYVYTFGSIGLFIIILACINYINLTTARAVERTAEMGIRKVLGYSRAKLFTSLLSEAILAAFLAMILSIVLSYFVLEFTPFNKLIEKDLHLNFVENPVLFIAILMVTLVIGVLSGIYPALYIPSVSIVNALKGSFKSQRSGVFIRKALISFQFVVSMMVIICTTMMGNQIDFMRSQELGYDTDNIVLLGIPDTIVAKQVPAVKASLLEHHNVSNVTFAYQGPGTNIDGIVFRVESEEGKMNQQHFNVIFAGHDYLETMGIELIEGRGFKKNNEADYYYSFLVNEAAVKYMQWGDETLGKKMTYFHSEQIGEVVGVVKDFNYSSLHNKIGPLVIILDSDIGGWMHVKVNGENLPETMAFIKETWTGFFPDYLYDYSFMDEGFNEQYKADEIQHQLVNVLSYLCIILSVLGLIGLSAFTAGQKTKEIGVRKALGASLHHIIFLFSREYLKLIIIGFIVAVPLANYLIVEWLKDFAYQMNFSIWEFAIPGLIVLVVSLLAVSGQSLKAAKANPVNALRSE